MGRLTERDKHEQGIWVDVEGMEDIDRWVEPFENIYPAINKLAHYEDLEEQGRLIDRYKLIMSIADWQMTLSPANNQADVFEYNVLESVIEHIAELKELEGVKE